MDLGYFSSSQLTNPSLSSSAGSSRSTGLVNWTYIRFKVLLGLRGECSVDLDTHSTYGNSFFNLLSSFVAEQQFEKEKRAFDYRWRNKDGSRQIESCWRQTENVCVVYGGGALLNSCHLSETECYVSINLSHWVPLDHLYSILVDVEL